MKAGRANQKAEGRDAEETRHEPLPADPARGGRGSATLDKRSAAPAVRRMRAPPEFSSHRFLLRISGLAMIMAAVGIALALFTSAIVFYQSRISAAESSQADAGIFADALAQRTRIAQAYLRAVTARVRGADILNREEFENFVSFLGPEPALEEIAWIPRVEAAQRAAFEERERQQGQTDFIIYDRDVDGGAVAATQRSEYYPIRLIAGAGAQHERVGLDLGADPAYRGLIAQALDSGRTAATRPHALLGGQPGFVIVEPVVATAGPRPGRVVAGLVAGTFRLDLLVAAAAPASLITRNVVIHDLAQGAEPLAVEPLAARAATPTDWPYKDILIGGRTWRVFLQPHEGQATESALIVLLVGLIATGLLVVVADRGQQRLISQDLRREVIRQTAALQRSSAEFRALFEEGGTGKCELVPETQHFRRVNLRLCEMLGYSREDLVKLGLDDVMHEDDVVRDEHTYRALLDGQTDSYSAEKRFRRKDGSLFWCVMSATVLRDDAGRPVWTVAVIQDITSRKKAEETRQLLVRELAHRVKNTLQVARSLADQTGRYAHDLDSFLLLYQGRLRALATAHDQLFKTDWGGADLQDVIEGTLGAFGPEMSERVQMDVPNVLLSSSETQTLALILNELATNAAKHGALSNETGQVAISGHVEEAGDRPGEPDRWLLFEWHESGGPPTAEPEDPGFGMTFLTRAVQHQHGGSTGFEWHEGGMRYTMRLPLHEERADRQTKGE